MGVIMILALREDDSKMVHGHTLAFIQEDDLCSEVPNYNGYIYIYIQINNN